RPASRRPGGALPPVGRFARCVRSAARRQGGACPNPRAPAALRVLRCAVLRGLPSSLERASSLSVWRPRSASLPSLRVLLLFSQRSDPPHAELERGLERLRFEIPERQPHVVAGHHRVPIAPRGRL